MEPRFIKLSNTDKQSFSIQLYRHSRFPGLWHYHHEFEITYIQKSQGTRIIGDHIEVFKEGDLIMIGENLPHTWKNDSITHVETKNGSLAVVIHFAKNCLGELFWELPENEGIKKLLRKAMMGIKITDPTRTAVIKMMKQMMQVKKPERLIIFLSILQIIAGSEDLQILSSAGFMNSLHKNDSMRINKVYEYTMDNFKSKISLVEVAQIVNMSPSAFSRYFKYRTRKSFSQFIIELRIGYACNLLSKDNETVTQVCYECGFNNISNFNKQFKKLNKMTPKKYQQSFIAPDWI